ncbi:MAG: peroxiredoxin family protein [Gammaproteobacteria bacterium]
MIYKKSLLAGFSLLLIVGIISVWFSPLGLQRAPEITLKILDGREIDLQQLRGKPVLVTFWATTCTVCMKELPHLMALYKTLAPAGLEIIGVAMAYDPPNRVLELSKQRQIPYPIALDIDGKVALAFGDVAQTPTSFLIGPDGAILQHRIGKMDFEALRQRITHLLMMQHS